MNHLKKEKVMLESNDLQSLSSSEAERIIANVKKLWTMQQLAEFLNISVQTIYDYRYKNRINSSIFIPLGKKLRINPRRAIQLALDGKLINPN
jgi:hypothetical protein